MNHLLKLFKAPVESNLPINEKIQQLASRYHKRTLRLPRKTPHFEINCLRVYAELGLSERFAQTVNAHLLELGNDYGTRFFACLLERLQTMPADDATSEALHHLIGIAHMVASGHLSSSKGIFLCFQYMPEYIQGNLLLTNETYSSVLSLLSQVYSEIYKHPIKNLFEEAETLLEKFPKLLVNIATITKTFFTFEIDEFSAVKRLRHLILQAIKKNKTPSLNGPLRSLQDKCENVLTKKISKSKTLRPISEFASNLGAKCPEYDGFLSDDCFQHLAILLKKNIVVADFQATPPQMRTFQVQDDVCTTKSQIIDFEKDPSLQQLLSSDAITVICDDQKRYHLLIDNDPTIHLADDEILDTCSLFRSIPPKIYGDFSIENAAPIERAVKTIIHHSFADTLFSKKSSHKTTSTQNIENPRQTNIEKAIIKHIESKETALIMDPFLELEPDEPAQTTSNTDFEVTFVQDGLLRQPQEDQQPESQPQKDQPPKDQPQETISPLSLCFYQGKIPPKDDIAHDPQKDTNDQTTHDHNVDAAPNPTQDSSSEKIKDSAHEDKISISEIGLQKLKEM